MDIEIGHYIINSQQQNASSGSDYELHNADTCEHIPAAHHRFTLGHFNNCQLAMEAAARQFPDWAEKIDGCAWCCPKCHTG